MTRSVAPGLILAASLFVPAQARASGGTVGDALLSDSISVEECAAMARAVAPTVQASSEDRAAASLDSTAAARNRRPSFSLGGGALIAPRGFYDPAVTNLGQYDLKIAAALPLLDGGSRSRERARGVLGAESASIDLELARRDAAIGAVAAALDIVRLREIARAEIEESEWLSGLETLIGAGVRAGTRGRGDALRVGLEQDIVAASLLSARSQSSERGRELGALIGRSPTGPPPVREPNPESDRAPNETDSLATVRAVAQAPEIRSAVVANAERILSLSDTQHRNSPRVDLSLDAGFSGTDLTTLVPPDVSAGNPGADFGDRLRRDLGGSLALVFRIPFWDTALRLGAAARHAGARATGLRLAAARDEQFREALNLLARWRAASERLALSQAAVQRAEDHMLRSKSLYAAGALTLMELLDARRLFDDARQRAADARFENRLTRFEVEVRR